MCIVYVCHRSLADKIDSLTDINMCVYTEEETFKDKREVFRLSSFDNIIMNYLSF